MWKITIIANTFFMILFWIASELAITPAYNNFIQYPRGGKATILPLATGIALYVIKFVVVLPIVWAIISFFIYKFTRQKTTADRNEYLLVFTSITIFVGFSMLVFFGLAGILPYLWIGTVVK